MDDPPQVDIHRPFPISQSAFPDDGPRAYTCVVEEQVNGPVGIECLLSQRFNIPGF